MPRYSTVFGERRPLRPHSVNSETADLRRDTEAAFLETERRGAILLTVLTFWDATEEGGLPVNPSEGDRYLCADAGDTDWQVGYVYEYLGADGGPDWSETSPLEGQLIQAADDAALYVYNGRAWVVLSVHPSAEVALSGEAPTQAQMKTAFGAAAEDKSGHIYDVSPGYETNAYYCFADADQWYYITGTPGL